MARRPLNVAKINTFELFLTLKRQSLTLHLVLCSSRSPNMGRDADMDGAKAQANYKLSSELCLSPPREVSYGDAVHARYD
jgi:hypothetical protein